MTPLYELERARIRGPRGTVVDPLELSLRDGAVTAVVGPAGSGKSTLLRALSGRELPVGWQVGGRWQYRGRDLGPVWRGRTALRNVAWLPQLRNGPVGALSNPAQVAAVRARLDDALSGDASVVLLDEPTRGLPRAELDPLITRIRERATRGAAIVVSHDLSFTRSVADDVCLLCEGELIAHCTAREFFDRPREDLVAQFVRSGSCAQVAPPPALPRHFYWTLPGQLAGMGRPGLMQELDDDLFAIAHAGVDLLVSLTEDPLPRTRLRPFGIVGRHFPVSDRGVPLMSETVSLCRELLQAIDSGQRVAVHCRAGLGRTGTILACLSVCRGQRAQDAISQLRRLAPGSIQTDIQESFVHRLAARARPRQGTGDASTYPRDMDLRI